MADRKCVHRHVRSLVDESRLWDAEFLLRNMEEEMDRFERGIAHVLWGPDDRTVTRVMRPLAVAPDFETISDERGYVLRVRLPGVAKENVSVGLDEREVEVLGSSDDPSCRPYYLRVSLERSLDVLSAEASMRGDVLEVRIPKLRKRVVNIS